MYKVDERPSRLLLLFKNIIAAVAQLVVHLICNQGVVGSSPIGGTMDPSSNGQDTALSRLE
jgi:hypothetical protein